VRDYPSGQDLSGHDLSGADLTGADPDLSGATIRDTALHASTESGAATAGWMARAALPPRARRHWTELDKRWTSFGETEKPPRAPRPPPPPLDPEWRKEWLPRAVVSGFVATGAMTIILVPAYFLALSLGSPGPQATTLQRWLWGLANNTLTQGTQTAFPGAVGMHFATGMVWALIYAALAEPRLSGPAWRRGVVFSLAPWILSVVVFFPAVGGGLFGFGLGAGPLPIVGNLIVHLIYGAVLGTVYGPASDRFQTETGEASNPEEVRILKGVERSIALGIVVGLAFGGLVGWLGSLLLAGKPLVMAVFGAVGGSLGGATIGSFWGMKA
jgi:uncharacterized protein DUF6789